MALRILIMGLPGSGKTTLARQLRGLITTKTLYSVDWINADQLRSQCNDWDFSPSGRIRQAMRIHELADQSTCPFVIADFVAALDMQRQIYNPDYTIWLDTIISSRYEDTNQMFEKPNKFDICICDPDVKRFSNDVLDLILKHNS